jgi:hypothetical protein
MMIMARLQFVATPGELRVLQAETEEMLQALGAHLLRLERESVTPAPMQERFRAGHTNAEEEQSSSVVRPSSLTRPDESTHHILVQFEPGSGVAVQALQTMIALGKAGDVLASRPTRAQIEAEQVHQRMEAWLRSELDGCAIQGVLAEIPELTILSLQAAADVEMDIDTCSCSTEGGPEGSNRAVPFSYRPRNPVPL